MIVVVNDRDILKIELPFFKGDVKQIQTKEWLSSEEYAKERIPWWFQEGSDHKYDGVKLYRILTETVPLLDLNESVLKELVEKLGEISIINSEDFTFEGKKVFIIQQVISDY